MERNQVLYTCGAAEYGMPKRAHFFPDSMASPFLHATILILFVETISLDSILNEAFLTMNVQTSSHKRYVCR